MAGLASCSSDIDNFMVDDTIGLLRPGLVEANVYTGLDDPYKVYAIKAGKGFQSVDVKIAVDDQVITDYNAEIDAKLEADPSAKVAAKLTALPADCYSISVSSLGFSKEDYKLPFEIKWNRDRLAEVLAEDANVAIPLRMTVGESDINVDKNRLTTMIKPVLEVPHIGLEAKSTGLIKGFQPTRKSAAEQDVYMKVEANFIAQQDIEYTLEVDPTLVDEYNEAHGTDYQMLPEDAYRTEFEGLTIKKYMSDSRFKFTIVRTALIPDNAPSKFGNYLLPIRLTALSSSNIDNDHNYVLYPVEVVSAEIDKRQWSIVDCNSNIAEDPDETTAKGAYGPEKLIDGLTNTVWHSIWTVEQDLPYIFTIDLGAKVSVFKLEYKSPTGGEKKNSNTKSGYVEGSLDGETWTKFGTWEAPNKNAATVNVDIEATSVRYIRFYITEVFGTISKVNNPNATAMAEINVYGEYVTWDE